MTSSSSGASAIPRRRDASGGSGTAAPWPAGWRHSSPSRGPAQRIDGVLSHCRDPLHTGLLEGINNKINVLKRMAYGFRDDAYCFLKIRAAFPGIPG